MKRFLSLLPAFALLVPVASAETFYLGTYTNKGDSKGIYRYELNVETGAVQDRGLAVETASPSFLALHPDKKHLYAVNEAGGGGVSAFAIQPDGSMKELNRESALGTGTTHVSLDREAKNVLAANYNSGSVAVLPIREDGSLGKATGFMQHTGHGPTPRQKGPNAHSVYVDETNRRALVADLGLDKVFLYKFDSVKGTLAPGEPPFVRTAPGAGPRHIALGAKGLVYVNGEMGNNVTVFAPDGPGLKQIQSISTLPEGWTGDNTTAEIYLHPNGKFLYVSNRGHDSIAAFKVAEDGQLTAIGHTSTGGKSPRYFGIHPQGKLLFACNQASGNVIVLKLNPDTGALTPAGVEFKRAQPVCIAFVE
jgi:6-phosphogluconolactonase